MGLVPALKAFESCEHQAIRLTRERGGEQRVMFRVSCQLLSERDEILYGRVPAGAVVVPGTLPAANGKYGLACAVIVKRVDAQTRAKTSLNELLRNTD